MSTPNFNAIHKILLILWVQAIKLIASSSYKASIGSNPNIIFVLTDDWGINDVSWTQPDWDNTDTQTPFLNDLANKEGVILSNYYAERVCTATRAAFLSGRYPSRYGLQAGVLHQNQPFGLTRQVSLLSNEFQSAGYSTHIIGYKYIHFSPPFPRICISSPFYAQSVKYKSLRSIFVMISNFEGNGI